VSTLLTELSATAHTFSCEAAAAKAQAMGARGLQTAEEARAAAAGAEAQALSVSVYGIAARHPNQHQHTDGTGVTRSLTRIKVFCLSTFEDMDEPLPAAVA